MSVMHAATDDAASESVLKRVLPLEGFDPQGGAENMAKFVCGQLLRGRQHNRRLDRGDADGHHQDGERGGLNTAGLRVDTDSLRVRGPNDVEGSLPDISSVLEEESICSVLPGDTIGQRQEA
jgi:hypothetical protein